MEILAIDTSSKVCSVAILENNKKVDEINLNSEKTHSENLIPMVDEILAKNNMDLRGIDLIGCSVGPGSFTGIRIGVASTKAMAEVENIPIASCTSLETLARMDESKKVKVALIDCRNNQVYCGIFDENYHKKQDLIADDILNVIEVLKKYENIICIGDGAISHKDLLKQNIDNIEFFDKNEQSAFYVGLIAYQKYLEKDLYSADSILPIYLRKSQAERMFNK